MLNLSCTTKKNYTTQDLLSSHQHSKQLAINLTQNKTQVKNTVDSFKRVFGSYQQETLLAAIDKLYAQDAFLNDRIHSIKGRDQIKKYFQKTFDKMQYAKFNIIGEIYGKTDVWINWVMTIKLKNQKSPMEFLGASQLRFNEQAEIIYHQDYWDFSELIDELSLIGSLIRYIKSKA